MSGFRPFCRITGRGKLVAFSVAILGLLTLTAFPPVRAQAAQGHADAASPAAEPLPRSDAGSSDRVGSPVTAAMSATAATAAGAGSLAAADAGNPAGTPNNAAAKAIAKVQQAARSATDIFSRVPCLPPKGGSPSIGSLPHVAGKLASGAPVVIIAFGSSSTQGYGSSSSEFTYPNRLAAQLRRHYPGADISVINRGKGGEDAPEMTARLQTEVIDAKPDLVIWQVGTNAVLRNLDPGETARLVEDGVSRIQAAGADIVLVDPQYSPKVNERAANASTMVRLLGRVARLRRIGLFPRFEVMREWHEERALPIDSFVIADGLHMNDWGYACFAQLLGDDIINSVGQIKLGVNVPSTVQAYRPM